MTPGALSLGSRLGAGGGLLLAALAVNGLLFGLTPWLVRDQAPATLTEPPRMVNLVQLPPPPPPEEPPPKPEPPQPPRELQTPRVQAAHAPQPTPQLELPALDIEINPQLTGGPALPAPPALPRAQVGALDRGPLVAGRVPPAYPYLARRRGVEGWVKVRFLVTREGQVEQLAVLAAQPTGFFEEAVLRAVPRWRFQPALSQGRPQDAWMETTIKFELE